MLETVNEVRVVMNTSLLEKDHLDIPHIYAYYRETHAIVSIKTGKVISGHIPSDKAERVESWVIFNNENLMLEWNRAKQRVNN